MAEVARATDLPARRILRLETLVEDLTAQTPDFATLVDQFDDAVGSAAERGIAALKSIAAYRSGLRLTPVDDGQRPRRGARRAQTHGPAPTASPPSR